MSGIADVARHAGVSKATASRALTGNGYVAPETRRRVEQAAAELGYIASSSAASLVTGRTRNVGVILPGLTRWFFSEVLEGVQSTLLSHGHDLTLYDATPGTEGRSAIFATFLGRKRFDGLIAVCIEPDHHEMERLLGLGKPMVSIGSYDMGAASVAVDDADAARRATEHLIDLGHRRIAFVGGPRTGMTHGDSLRLHAYLGAMSAAGLGDLSRHATSAVSMPGGYGAAVDLLGDSRDRPTAIVGVCDEVAIGAIIAARRLGLLVPSDLSVVGIDDHENAEMFALTTLQQRPREQGCLAARLLLRRLDDPDAEREHIREASRLVVRSSTAAADAAQSAITAGVGRRRD
jgi:DNA-binding LacI/PurR family transcriptional regulator